MEWISVLVLMGGHALGADPVAENAQTLPNVTSSVPSFDCCRPMCDCCAQACPTRGRFESDHAFDGFVGPITNPVLSKDPRSLTEARFLFINNIIPAESAIGPGNLQLYAMQVRLAITDRLTLTADKDGYASIFRKGIGSTSGFVNLAAGLKYALIRDVDRQFLLTTGLMFEPTTGEANVFQNHGDGLFTWFLTSGKEFGQCNHFVGTMGYQFPVNSNQNSGFYYATLHLDRQIRGWFYPLVEMNWFHWVDGGDRGIPATVGEGDGLLNLGTSGVAGNDLLTMAFGAKAKISSHAETGLAWEFPIRIART